MSNYKNYTKGTYTESDELKEKKKQQDYWYGQDYKQFSWDDSMASDTTKSHLNNLNALQAPEWNGYSRQGEWDNILNNITNMKDFSYDVNGDALYQQYKDTYSTQGKMAMMDTMGQAAALTGGYGNSYAQSVGQQTYQGYMQQLADKVPELYSLALSKYNSDRDNLYKQSDLHQNLFNNEYGMYRNDVSDYNTNRSYYADQYNAGLNRDYNTALAENDSYNSIISNNRNEYATAVNNLATREWGQYTDSESLAAQAIQIYNDNITAQANLDLARDELDEKKAQNAWQNDFQERQFSWQQDQSNLQAENDALKNQYVVDNAAMDKVVKGILSEDEFKDKAVLSKRTNNAGFFGNLFPSNAFETTYSVDGNTFNSYNDYIDYVIRVAYESGSINEASARALREKYDLD